MITVYHHALLVTSEGIKAEPLVINTYSGRILSPLYAPFRQREVDASGLYLYPGLINAHDHLEMNHYPRTKPRNGYANARQWAADMTAHIQQEPFASLQQVPLPDRCLVGGLKNLLSGVTTVAQHNPLHRPLTRAHFPVRVVRNYGWAHSLYLWEPPHIQHSYQQTRRGRWMIHLAEGTDTAAAAEADILRDLGCVSNKTLLIHGVGLAEPLLDAAGLVWCPSTNLFLLGQTAQVRAWFQAGKLALGSDSRLTADGDLLDELRAAYQTGQLSAPELFALVTHMAAQVLDLPDVGDLLPGMRADVLALPQSADPYTTLIQARRSDIQWVMRGGQILWTQDAQNPNFMLDRVPLRLAPFLQRQLQQCSLAPT